MSKEHQFIIKSIIRGDRTPMYLETYTLGDRSSQVYKDAMKLLGKEHAQQEVSLDLALELSSADKRASVGQVVEMGIDYVKTEPKVSLGSSVRGDILGVVSPGKTLAHELQQRYPNKNWKGLANKAFEAFTAADSKYSKQDIAICLLNLHPGSNMDTKYRELLDLDYPTMASPVRGDLLIEHDRMLRINAAMALPRTFHITLDEAADPQVYVDELKQQFIDKYTKPTQLIFTADEVKKYIHHFSFHAAVPLTDGNFGAVNSNLLDQLVFDAADKLWDLSYLAERIARQFQRADSEKQTFIDLDWLREVLDVEHRRQLEIQPKSNQIYTEQEMRGLEHKCVGYAILPLDNGYKAVVDARAVQNLILTSIDRSWQATHLRRRVEELFNRRDGGKWHSVEEGWFLEALRKERAALGKSEEILASAVIEQLRNASADVLVPQALVNHLNEMYVKGQVSVDEVVHAVFEVLGHPTSYEEFIVAERTCSMSSTLRELCLARFGMTEEPPRSFVANMRYHYHPEQLDDVFIIGAIDNALRNGSLMLPEAVGSVMEVLDFPETFAKFDEYLKQRNAPMSQVLHQACSNEYTPIEGARAVYVLGDSETQEITSVTQSTYYRNEQFKDHIAFGTAPGSRSQQEIIGVLAYELEANENEPDCVSVTHYQFFYQGDSVFVTDRYGNTVDRLR